MIDRAAILGSELTSAGQQSKASYHQQQHVPSTSCICTHGSRRHSMSSNPMVLTLCLAVVCGYLHRTGPLANDASLGERCVIRCARNKSKGLAVDTRLHVWLSGCRRAAVGAGRSASGRCANGAGSSAAGRCNGPLAGLAAELASTATGHCSMTAAAGPCCWQLVGFVGQVAGR